MNTEHLMNGILCYHKWKRKILGWYQFRTMWYLEGASRFLRSRMSITPSLQLEQNGRTQKHSKYYSREDRILMDEEPSIEDLWYIFSSLIGIHHCILFIKIFYIKVIPST